MRKHFRRDDALRYKNRIRLQRKKERRNCNCAIIGTYQKGIIRKRGRKKKIIKKQTSACGNEKKRKKRCGGFFYPQKKKGKFCLRFLFKSISKDLYFSTSEFELMILNYYEIDFDY